MESSRILRESKNAVYKGIATSCFMGVRSGNDSEYLRNQVKRFTDFDKIHSIIWNDRYDAEYLSAYLLGDIEHEI